MNLTAHVRSVAWSLDAFSVSKNQFTVAMSVVCGTCRNYVATVVATGDPVGLILDMILEKVVKTMIKKMQERVEFGRERSV